MPLRQSGGTKDINARPLSSDIPKALTRRNFTLVTPYDSDPRKWLDKEWIDQYAGKRFRGTTAGHYGRGHAVRVKTYGDILAESEFHPETKCADSAGPPCEKQTVGLLERRHIKIDQIRCIGKESNSLENVDEGLVHSEKTVYTEYVDSKRDEWTTKIQPALKRAKLSVLVKECGNRLSRRELIELRARCSRPHRKTKDLLVPIFAGLGLL